MWNLFLIVIVMEIQGVRELLDTLQNYLKQKVDGVEIKCLY